MYTRSSTVLPHPAFPRPARLQDDAPNVDTIPLHSGGYTKPRSPYPLVRLPRNDGVLSPGSAGHDKHNQLLGC